MGKRGRGRPKREYRVRVRVERREKPDYRKLARALLEYAARQDQIERDEKAAAEAAAEPPTGGDPS